MSGGGDVLALETRAFLVARRGVNLTAMRVWEAVLLKRRESARGGGENLRIHDLHLTDPHTDSGGLNWNPSQPAREMPKDVKNPPVYWKVPGEDSRRRVCPPQ